MGKTVRRFQFAALLIASLLLPAPTAQAADPELLESGLSITIGGETKTLSLSEAMAALNIPSVSIAVIDQDRIAFARAYGQSVTPDTLFQAASLSKFVAAIGTMRLVDQNKLSLDDDVNKGLTSWHVPANDFDKDHKVTLRGLLNMTAGIGVPGFIGYELGAPLPTLTQILDGTPPANSAPVTVIAVPGSAYHYSGGGYEIVEALMVCRGDGRSRARTCGHDPLDLRSTSTGGPEGKCRDRTSRRRDGAQGRVSGVSGACRRGSVVDADRSRQSSASCRQGLARRERALPRA
jgi:CubicO group peptidase (beta-lactamase class C family)